MSWQQIQLADASPNSWLNGGGQTRELVTWPTADDWTWRLSVAEVATSGPFSLFDGVERCFAVVNGAGVRLQVAESEHTLTGASAPFCFDGASRTDCRLLAGPTQGLNLMVRRNRASAQMRRLNGDLLLLSGATSFIAVYSIDSVVRVRCQGESRTVPAQSLVWRTLSCEAEFYISATNALWIEIAL